MTQIRRESSRNIKSDSHRKIGVGYACAGHNKFRLFPKTPSITLYFSPVLIFGLTLPTGSIEKFENLLI
jgi:hypothetical protein